ncbi:M20 family metallopeptidase [Faunimonas sp. B44]|uniref:M20 family metallopeptidase n=1 Tax=Faunimonas sp. B44 TaxID=3461493 RepID=UPI0040450A5D
MLHQTTSQYITKERVAQTLVEMVNISSPTGGEADMANYVVDRMRKAGLETELQYVSEGRPNAVGHIKGTGGGTNLLFTGHMDTSYDGTEDYLSGDGFKPQAVEKDGWIWGLGASNMKSGLASALVAVEAIARSGIRLAGDISFGGVVGEIEKTAIEEFQGTSFAGYGVGSKHLVTHGVTADYAILMEPTQNRISPANMGCVWFRVTVTGTVNHSAFSSRPGVVNAITLMTELYPDLMEWGKRYEAAHSFMGEHPNITLGAIRGGAPWRLSRNPYSCSLYIEARLVPGQSIEAVKRDLRSVLNGFAERTGTGEPELYVYLTDPATAISEDLPIIDALGQAQAQVSGERKPSIIRRPGADAVHFTVYGVPCVSFGPGGRVHPDLKGQPMHVVGEHANVDELVTAANIYVATALDLCNRAPS